MKTLHGLVMDKIDPHAGELRTVPVYIRGASFTPPAARDVPGYLAQWVSWLTSDAALRYDPVTRAAVAHHDFEALHQKPSNNISRKSVPNRVVVRVRNNRDLAMSF